MNVSDEELCEIMRYGEESELLGVIDIAAARIEELSRELERLNKILVDLSEPF